VKALRWLVLGVSMLAIDTSAFAATLTSIQGSVQVSTGKGFHPVTGSTQVSPGASIMAAPGASAEIVYSDGCRIPVKAGAVVGVAPVSPCAQGADLAVPTASGQVNTAYGQVGSDQGYVNYLGYGLALGAGIGIGCAIWCSQHGNTVVVTAPAPTSP
jgi:hypothetical protein